MEGNNRLNNGNQKGKGIRAVSTSEDFQEHTLDLNIGGSSIFEEEKGSEHENQEKKETASDQPKRTRLYIPAPRIAYECEFCELRFSSEWALAGHQNVHRYKKEQAAKRQKTSDYVLPLNNGNKFPFSSSSLGSPNIKYKESAIGLTCIHDQLPSNFTGTSPVYDKPEMTYPKKRKICYGYYNCFGITSCGRVGTLEGIQAPSGNSTAAGGNYNSLPIIGGSGSGITTLGLHALYENSVIPPDGVEAAVTNSGMGSNVFELSLGGIFENLDAVREGDRGDNGTVDLLSQIGKSNGKDAEHSDHGKGVSGS